MHPNAPHITTFAQLAAEGADALRIADVAMARWSDVGAALSPIIGQSGVAALFKRSLHLTRTEHSCLAYLYESAWQAGEFTPPRTAFAQEISLDAAAANDALLHTFHNLLTNLIGASLTGRLLRSTRNPPSSGHAVHYSSP